MKKTLLSFGAHRTSPAVAEPEVLPPKKVATVGLFALLNEEQKAKALALKEPENFGPDDLLLKDRACS